jgi:hypothetical protein
LQNYTIATARSTNNSSEVINSHNILLVWLDKHTLRPTVQINPLDSLIYLEFGTDESSEFTIFSNPTNPLKPLGNETIFTPKPVNKPGAKLVTLDIPDISTADFLLVAN